MKTVSLCLLVLLTACATPQKLNTASGHPEVSVHAKLARVRSVATNHFVDNGWTPVKTEGTQLVFQKHGSATQDFMMGLLTNEPNSTLQLTLTLIENGSNVRVVGGATILGQNTFGRQTNVEWTGSYVAFQKGLEAIKQKAES